MKNCFLIGIILLVLTALTACYSPNKDPRARFNPYSRTNWPGAFQTVDLSNRLAPDLLKMPTEPFRLGPGDKLEMELIGDIASRTLTTVGPDGKVYFNLLPGVDVWGHTLAESKQQFEREMRKFIRENPQISVTLRGVESKRVWLLGRFQNPGVYPMPAPMTVLEAISLAGGPVSLNANQASAFAYSSEEVADLRRSFLIRNGQRMPVDFERLLKGGDLSQNIFLQADDLIYFPTATQREVYVLGAVANPQAIPYNTELTLAAAIAHANGTIKDSYPFEVAIVRGSLTHPQVAIVNLKGIQQGKTPDVLLQPQDIVYVPFSPWRYPAKYANLALDTFVTSVAISEGANAAVRGETTPATGVFIPVGGTFSITPTAPTPPTVRP